MPAKAHQRIIAGRYELDEELGRGGMGVVWCAMDTVLGRRVAVKEVIPPSDLSPAERSLVRERTMREARAAARISSPHAVTVYDVVEDRGSPWVVMELLHAQALSQLVLRHGPMAPAAVAEIGVAVLDALSAAHRAGVLHRDVKPSNVMIGDEGRVVLTDFGIATLDGDPSVTATGLLLGSPAYIAPERARGGQPSPASDLWSLGATLYAAVEGKAPFDRGGQLQTLAAVLSEDPPAPARAGALRPVLMRLLDKDPSRRPSAHILRRELTAIAATRAPAPTPAAASDELTAVLPIGQDGERTQRITVPPAPAASPAVAVRPTAVPAPVQPVQALPVAAPQPAGQREAPLDLPGFTSEPTVVRRRRSPVLAGLLLAGLLGTGAVAYNAFADDGENAPVTGAEKLAPKTTPGTRSSGAAGAGAGAAAPGASATATQPSVTPSPTSAAVGAGAGTVAEPLTPSAPAGVSTPAASAGKPSAADPLRDRPAAGVSSPAGTGSSSSGSSSSGSSASNGATTTGAGSTVAYTKRTDSTGFTIELPPSWKRSIGKQGIYYREAGTGNYLLVAQTTHPEPDAYVDLVQNKEPYFRQHHAGYRRIVLQRVDYKGFDAADWELTYSGTNGRVHALDRNIRVSNSQAYALFMFASDRTWARSRAVFDHAAASFKPR